MNKIYENLNFNTMIHRSLKLAVLLILAMIVSCDEPETVVTNIVYPDGSVTRKIEMKNQENKFEFSDLQVPFDSTWTVKDSIEINEKGDTTWVKRAEKHFKNTGEINKDYMTDKGANKGISRKAEFSKRFRWFNTEYIFAEKIDKSMLYGYPISDFLNKEELEYYFSPASLKNEKQNGPDSLKYRTFEDTISHKTDRWISKNIVSEWIGEFTKLTEGDGEIKIENLKEREDELVNLIDVNNPKFDSLWANGILLGEIIGAAKAEKYKIEADTAITKVINRLLVNFKEYSVRIVMPGKLIGTNGFIDSSEVLIWPVKSDFFLSNPYEMWAESKIPNRWTWIVSGLFLIFVIAGILFRIIKKG